MFRYERPQAGRFRQFHQIGGEAFGVSDPKMDAEIISMLRLFLETLGLRDVSYEVNSIGCALCRPDYQKALVSFFSGRLERLCPDCRKRYAYNPLRILDCKVGTCVTEREKAPLVSDFLCAECKAHFEKFLCFLGLFKVSYIVNPVMVRGLDYYTRTTFEITGRGMGSQNAIAAGGRYDKLVEEFGGPATPAIGFAIGMERVASLLKDFLKGYAPAPRVFLALLGESAEREGLLIAEELRARGVWVESGYGGLSLKSQMRRAGRISAEYVFIIGDEEVGNGIIKWKNLDKRTQGEIEISRAIEFISAIGSRVEKDTDC